MEKDSSSWGGLPKHPPCSLDSLHSTQKEPGTLLMPPDGCFIPTWPLGIREMCKGGISLGTS